MQDLKKRLEKYLGWQVLIQHLEKEEGYQGELLRIKLSRWQGTEHLLLKFGWCVNRLGLQEPSPAVITSIGGVTRPKLDYETVLYEPVLSEARTETMLIPDLMDSAALVFIPESHRKWINTDAVASLFGTPEMKQIWAND